MAPRQASPTALLLLLSAASFLTLVSVLMLGPLLVALAHEFQTSVAIVGQLAALHMGVVKAPVCNEGESGLTLRSTGVAYLGGDICRWQAAAQ
jgi:hypothetical protein